MFRIVSESNAQPASFICDPSAEFKPGQIAQLTVVGNQVMCTVSDGTAPIGIIDDIRTRAFTNISWDEVILVSAIGVPGPNGQLITPVDIKAELRKPNILAKTFSSTIDVVLNPINGVITFLAGTPLNFDNIGSGQPNALRTIVRYTYQVPNIPGDDSVIASGKVTVWYNRMFFQTDMFETNQQYPVRAPLYVNETGLLTTRKPGKDYPSIAMVTAPPTAFAPMLECLWY